MLRLLIVIATASLAFAITAAEARAVIDVPTTGATTSVPPIQNLPLAGETPPPADVIADPVEPNASCSGWYVQSHYAGLWPTASTWWEYECTLVYVVYPWCYGMEGACDAGYWELGSWTDRFYWDGSQAIFYGENSQFGCDFDHWWDAFSSRWYEVVDC
jgi:hypothetical protein